MPKPAKIEPTPELTRAIAARRARGVSLRDLETEFGFSRPVVNRILASDEARQVILDITRDDLAVEVAMNRRALSELVPGAIVKLAEKVEQGDIKSIELVLRGSGMLTPVESKEGNQAQAITVILPGQAPPKEVPNEIESI